MVLVLYRKYRPKSFGEVVGQEHVVTTLKNALALNRVGHAYLFAGPRGTGKTTVARLLAKAVNCAELSGKPASAGEPLTARASAEAASEGGLPFQEACNACIHCTAILEGRHPDLVEIDAASNRGIDEIRQLKESVRVVPMQARMKTYIIDETHMLTEPAFNALLKTLEEPPPHAMFVLATTEINKVPATIQSRTQRFDFKTVPLPKIVARLATIVAAEQADVSPKALELIAQAADGSMRDAESMLEQILAFSGGAVSEQEAIAILGLADLAILQTIVAALAQKDAGKAIAAINNAMEHGVDATHLAIAVASYLRDILLLSLDAKLEELLLRRAGAGYVEAAKQHANLFSPQELAAIIPKIVDALELTKRSPVPQLPLELAIMEITHTDSVPLS